MIALSAASPAHAASTLGLISFVDPDDLIGSDYTATFTIQLTVPPGGTVPATVNVSYSAPGILDGPITVPTGGQTTFTFEATALDRSGATDITVSAPEYVSAITTVEVTADNGGLVFFHSQNFGTVNAANVWAHPTNFGARTADAQGHYHDVFANNKFLYQGLGSANTVAFRGILCKGNQQSYVPLKGRVDYTLFVLTPYGNSSALAFAQADGFANSNKPLSANTIINGRTTTIGTIIGADEYNGSQDFDPGTNANIKIQRKAVTSGSNLLLFALAFPRFPRYDVQVSYEF